MPRRKRDAILAAFFVLAATTAHGTTMGYWRFEEGGGTLVNDSSGNLNTGVDWSTPTYETDVPMAAIGGDCAANAYSMGFDGVADAVVIQDGPSMRPNGEITIEAWCLRGSNNHEALLGKQIANGYTNSFQIELYSNLTRFQLTDTAGADHFVSGAGVPVGAWTHVAGTWDGTTMRLYIGCEEVGSAPFSGPIGYDGNPMLIAAEDDTDQGHPNGFFFTGLIDEVRLSDVALDPGGFLCQPCPVSVDASSWGSVKSRYR